MDMESTITNDPDGMVCVCVGVWVWYWLRSGIGLGYHRLPFPPVFPFSLLYSDKFSFRYSFWDLNEPVCQRTCRDLVPWFFQSVGTYILVSPLISFVVFCTTNISFFMYD